MERRTSDADSDVVDTAGENRIGDANRRAPERAAWSL